MRNVLHRFRDLDSWFLTGGVLWGGYGNFKIWGLTGGGGSLKMCFERVQYHPTSGSFSLLHGWRCYLSVCHSSFLLLRLPCHSPFGAITCNKLFLPQVVLVMLFYHSHERGIMQKSGRMEIGTRLTTENQPYCLLQAGAVIFFSFPGLESLTSHILGKRSTLEFYPSPQLLRFEVKDTERFSDLETMLCRKN